MAASPSLTPFDLSLQRGRPECSGTVAGLHRNGRPEYAVRPSPIPKLFTWDIGKHVRHQSTEVSQDTVGSRAAFMTRTTAPLR
jgi:hypothetical protein